MDRYRCRSNIFKSLIEARRGVVDIIERMSIDVRLGINEKPITTFPVRDQSNSSDIGDVTK
jgi:hypothetical protein